MKTKQFPRNTFIWALLFAYLLRALAYQPSDAWRTINLPFRPLNITSRGSMLWVCGTDESIAVTSDGGAHWQVKHQTNDGNLLLNVEFANEKFGYAAGTGGLILLTEDGGQTWTSHSTRTGTIQQISFADKQHGLIRTPATLLFTSDGGNSWSTVLTGSNSEILKDFPYTSSLVALDTNHMAVMLKQGAAQYEPQTLLVTGDSGKTWQIVKIPNVTLYSFLRNNGKYWTVGTEVVHKDQPGGGYAVPVALYSSDGQKWEHSTIDLSSCKPEMCVACTFGGCLSSNSSITNFFPDKSSYEVFPPNEKLTSRWGSTDSEFCFISNQLQCSNLQAVAQTPHPEGPGPVSVSPGPLGVTARQEPYCISCELDQVLVNKKVQGAFTINLAIVIAANGTVTSVQSEGAPTPEIKSQIEQQIQSWLFEPFMKDGIRVALKLNTAVRVNVLKTD
jgi:hypothetical protein